MSKATEIRVTGLHIDGDELVGEGGFLAIRRLHLRNRRADGSLSAPYVCDFAVRAMGLDAVVVAVYCRDPAAGADDLAGGRTRVLLREGLRPALALGRRDEPIPVPDRRAYLFLPELVAGVVERGDLGHDGIRRRAAEEVHEEAGLRVAPEDVELLGAGVFPTPGSMPEKFWLAAVQVPAAAADAGAGGPLPGDGSPMEEGATTRWLDLDDAIAACVAGDIEDCKTELTLRRLRDRLRGRSGGT